MGSESYCYGLCTGYICYVMMSSQVEVSHMVTASSGGTESSTLGLMHFLSPGPQQIFQDLGQQSIVPQGRWVIMNTTFRSKNYLYF